MENIIPYNHSKKKKYLGINITKYVLYFYVKNYKTLMTEIEYLNKWRDIAYPWIRKHNNGFISPQIDTQFSCNSYQFPSKTFCRYKQNFLKCICKVMELEEPKGF